MSDLIYTLRYRRGDLVADACAWLARRLPLVLRRAVIVDAAVRATTPPAIGPDEYAGPDGVDFKRMYDAAAL